MTSAIISDTTGKTIKQDLSWQVDVYNRGSKAHLKLDTEFNDSVKTLCRLAVQNGLTWYQFKKAPDGSWEKLKVKDPLQEQID